MRSNPLNTKPNPTENRPTVGPTLQHNLAARQTAIDGDEQSIQNGSGMVNNGSSERLYREHAASDSGPQSRISTPSSRSLSPTRYLSCLICFCFICYFFFRGTISSILWYRPLVVCLSCFFQERMLVCLNNLL
jgi:hypothetical protein